MNRFSKILVVFLLTVFSVDKQSCYAQSGDQILDGIGETGMVARYIFNGDTKDWSRNNLHANFTTGKPHFFRDPKFGNVLALSGKQKQFITLPPDVLSNIESLSISTWVNLRSEVTGQYIFDFGQGNSSLFWLSPSGNGNKKGLLTGLKNTKTHKEMYAIAPELGQNKWEHIVVVFDAPSRTVTTFLNNKKIAELNNVDIDFRKMISNQEIDNFVLNVGQSLIGKGKVLDALLHDFRIYRVPLTSRQVSNIYTNLTKGVRQDQGKMGKAEDNLQEFPVTQAQLYNTHLVDVEHVNVETVIGELPRLPSYVNGTYKEGITGPKVRVIWPAPINNSDVMIPGEYVVIGKIPGTTLQTKAFVTINSNKKEEKPSAKLEMFPLDRTMLNLTKDNEESRFIENRNKFINSLAQTDPNSFLFMFRNAFGQKQPEGAKALGVWDSQDTKLRGHATGHYLTAIAQAYASTSYDQALQDNFEQKINTMIDELYRLSKLSGKPYQANVANADPTQVPKEPLKDEYDSDLSVSGIRTDYWNWGEGFISAYPPDQFIMLEAGAKYGGQKNQVWAPYYTLHKILAGLLDVYIVTGNKKALEIAVDMSDWVHERLNAVPKETLVAMWNTYIAGEFGGMNETLARLSAITGNPKYLNTAQLFDNVDMFFGNSDHVHGLAKNVDTFRGLHANQHIPQIVGSIEMYGVSNLDEYYKVADNFWYKAVNDYMYSIGGVAGARNPANAECFIGEPSSIYENGFSVGGQNETCATYNMLKLTTSLFLYDQRVEYMDYYERGLYNHILASVDKNTPANTYHVSLRPGSFKEFGNPQMTGFTCCNGTAIESSTKLQNAIYFKNKANDALYVNLFIPSTLNWEERNITVQQITNFPKKDESQILINGDGVFDLHIRVPSWAKNGFSVHINGVEENVDALPGTYLKLSKTWKKGDVIDLKMPFDFYLDPVADQQNIASLFYGPVLLAAQESEPLTEWRKVTLDAHNISNSIQGNPETLEFQIGDVKFKPFYDTYDRHSVYLNVTLK